MAGTANTRVKNIEAELRDIQRTWTFLRKDREAMACLGTAIFAVSILVRRVQKLTATPPPPGGIS
jgi:hypothetical protein